jgi:hypothetical protein
MRVRRIHADAALAEYLRGGAECPDERDACCHCGYHLTSKEGPMQDDR